MPKLSKLVTNFPNIDCELINAMGIDGVNFVKCIQEGLFKQYGDSSTREGIILDPVSGNEPCQVIGISMEEHFGRVITIPYTLRLF